MSTHRGGSWPERGLAALLAMMLLPALAPGTAVARPAEWLTTVWFGDRLAWQSEGGGWLLAVAWAWALLNVALAWAACRQQASSASRATTVALAAWVAWSLLDPWTRQDGPLPTVDLALRCAAGGLALWLATVPGRAALDWFQGPLLLALGWEAAAGVLRYLTGGETFQTPGFGARAGGTFAGPAGFFPVALGAALWGWVLLLRGPSRPVRTVGASLCLLGGSAVLYTYHRSAWLGLAVGLLAVPRAPRAARLGAALAATVLLVGLLVVRTGGRLPGGPGDPSGQSRLELWRLGLRCATESPLVGAGLGNWYQVAARHATPWSQQAHLLPGEPKSLLLGRLVEQGLVGLLLFLGLSWQVWRLGSRRSAPLAAVAAAVHLVGLHAAGLFDTPILASAQPGPTLLLLALIGCGAGAARPIDPPAVCRGGAS